MRELFCELSKNGKLRTNLHFAGGCVERDSHSTKFTKILRQLVICSRQAVDAQHKHFFSVFEFEAILEWVYVLDSLWISLACTRTEHRAVPLRKFVFATVLCVPYELVDALKLSPIALLPIFIISTASGSAFLKISLALSVPFHKNSNYFASSFSHFSHVSLFFLCVSFSSSSSCFSLSLSFSLSSLGACVCACVFPFFVFRECTSFLCVCCVYLLLLFPT